MITKIEVQGLYEVFNHSISLKDESITLILGENGLGKTLILKMIKAFFDKDFFELNSYHFTKFILNFDDESIITVSKGVKNNLSENFNIAYKRKSKNLEKYVLNLNSYKTTSGRININTKHFYGGGNGYDKSGNLVYYNDFNSTEFSLGIYLPPFVEKVGKNKWLDESRGVLMSTDDVLDYYQEYLPKHLIKDFNINSGLPKWLTDKTDSVNTKFIETQRLLTKIKAGESEYHSSVSRYSKELVEAIKNRTVAATDLASKLDRSYPNRVIHEITKIKKISDQEIEVGLSNLNKRREVLNKVGLLDTEEENLQPINNAINRQQAENKELLKDVLQIYLEDSNQKLEIYSDLASKLELFIDLINKRFLYKTISIDKKAGFVFTSSITNKNIPLSGLSSGEQHELVLFYQLLFNTEPNSLLLIDEPEISLHISWQNHFINDLRDVIKLTNFSAIIATHSPDIINSNWDLTVQLKGIN
ncbi:putative ATP-binding protein involved in virulence [Flavobacterium sp. 2755]|uniref:AAA family ATPase n=1 Tax=Flavobacterium sp. 2755 TaxID=2817765 RepID=UPI002861A9A9|nr:AAA family ATPase [Flavobacterium sp. 2755]MDR6763597.1 putative ATP-binding protein involved in virulence [Flavobacterium sp. 2755]